MLMGLNHLKGHWVDWMRSMESKWSSPISGWEREWRTMGVDRFHRSSVVHLKMRLLQRLPLAIESKLWEPHFLWFLAFWSDNSILPKKI